MKQYINYLKYVLRHKFYVMIECFKVGLYWRGLLHDISKFLPSEFIPYANHFYYNDGSFKEEKRNTTGYYKAGFTDDPAFDFAWLLHQKRNRHHWQWWTLVGDTDEVKILEIPLVYKIEMLCDWRGAGKAQNNPTSNKDWYLANKDKMQLHPNTREWLEIELGIDKIGG